MDSITLTKKLDVKKQYDVIVCGGGVAGVAAAVTTANNGHSVLLIEKSNILGGLATMGLINFFVPMCNGRGKQIIFGLCEKWARLSAQYGYDTIMLMYNRNRITIFRLQKCKFFIKETQE